MPTDSALHFVGAATWSALSGHPVSTEVWDDVHEVPHVRIGQAADLVVVAPATADMLAKAAHGLADDLLTNTLLTARCPVVFAPAMHTEMWEHPATQENVATLRRRGAVVIEPAVGRLTGVDTGKGRLPDPGGDLRGLPPGAGPRRRGAADLAGRHVVVSAGGTREPLDPVRFLGNRSSGKQGYALARTAVARGARVTLVAANTGLPDPAGVDVVRVGTAVQLREAVLKAAADADAVVMAAAVADFRPADVRRRARSRRRTARSPHPSPWSATRTSSPRSPPTAPAPARWSSASPPRPTTSSPTAATKLARKGCDLLVVNEVGERKTFGSEENEAVVLAADGGETPGAVRPQGSPRRHGLGPGGAPRLGRDMSCAIRARVDAPKPREHAAIVASPADRDVRSALADARAARSQGSRRGETGGPAAERDR